MERLLVEAERLVSVGYNARKGDLEVEMTSGEIYLYLGVTAPTYVAFMNSDSKDAYFERSIKDVFIFKRVN